MQRGQIGSMVCSVCVAAMLGCDGGADVTPSENVSNATSCAIEAFDTTWWNQAFPEQTGRFHAELSIEASASNVDLVVGLSNGAATKWTSLAAIVRFNPQGFIDARDGNAYRADVSFAYQPNTPYQIRFDVDVRTHRYSVWIRQYYGYEYQPLARDYAFRTEQASVTKLNNVASFINPDTSANGSGTLCGFTVAADDTTADGCISSSAGGTFANAPIASSTNVSIVSFTATPGATAMDGVVGVTSGNADAYDDYAASIRFYTNGFIEARDGDAYRADRTLAYAAGTAYPFKVFVDLASHSYSVYVVDPSVHDYVPLAINYRFRPAQSRVASLDRIATIVASSAGSVKACSLTGGPHRNLIAMRPGSYDLAPRADGSLVASTTGQTMLIDSANVPGRTIDVGGQVAADGAGNVYVADASNGSLHVYAYTPTLDARWSTGSVVDGVLQDIEVTSANELALVFRGTGQYDWKPTLLGRHGQTGQFALDSLPADTTAIGLGLNHYVLARQQSDGYLFERYAYGNPTPLASRTIAGNYDVMKIAVAADDSFVIAGRLYTATNFGDGEITYFAPTPDSGVYWDEYVVSFGADMSTRFSRRMTNDVYGLATTGRWIAISFVTWTQLHYADYQVLDVGGTPLYGTDEDAYVSSFGFSGTIALTPSGRAYWNLGAPLQGPNDEHFPFLLTLTPP